LRECYTDRSVAVMEREDKTLLFHAADVTCAGKYRGYDYATIVAYH